MNQVVRLIRRDEGSSVVEMVFIAPALMAALTFVVVAGRLATADVDVSTASHAAARSASLATTPDQALSAAQRIAATIPSSAACSHRDVKVDTGSFKPGGTVRVTISCHISLEDITGLVPGTTTLSSTSVSPIDPFRSAS